MRKKKTHEEYVEEVKIKNPNIEVIELYVNSSTRILHKCKICKHEWRAYPENILKGHGCSVCVGVIRKTHNEYVSELSIKNPNVIAIDEYINAKTSIKHKCLIHNYIWSLTPTDALKGQGCPLCRGMKISDKQTKSHDQYISECQEKRPNIEVLGTYIDSKTQILHKCKIHNLNWLIRPYDALYGEGCPKCRSDKISSALKKDNSWYIEKLKIERPHIIALDEYIDYRTPIKHYCTLHQYEWIDSPRCIFRDLGCPKCTGYKHETTISDWLDSFNILYIRQYTFDNCKDKRALPFDFYLPDLNICIEYDGRQHYEPVDFAGKGDEWAKEQLKITQYHDAIKNEYCKNNNIPLLRISYLQNIEEELQNFIRLI